MNRWLPYPILSALLLGTWLLINEGVDAGQVLLGTVLALFLPRFLRGLLPPPIRIGKPWLLVPLLAGVLVEITRSCFNVSRIILFTRHQDLNSQFITVPLDIETPAGLAALSCIINCTPGTVWVEVLPGTNLLALHVFDLHDAQWWVETIKRRYEKPLIEIFPPARPCP